MERHNRLAADAVFEENNSAKGRGDDIIDLHGLHVNVSVDNLTFQPAKLLSYSGGPREGE